MKASGLLGTLIAVLLAAGAAAQPQIPVQVQLPDEDFVWPWGKPNRQEDLERPQFEIRGVEQNFKCTLTGSFRPGSRMSDFENLRNFENSLATTLYFASEATATLNYYYRENQLDWALLDCVIPDFDATEDVTQERIDRAVERAERARERRRRRDDSSDD